MEDKLREALLTFKLQGLRPGCKRDAELVYCRSKAARKFTLHPGRGRTFAAAEAALHKLYRERRTRGLRVRGSYLRIQMKRFVHHIYGGGVADQFKACKTWLAKFFNCYNMSLRKSTNKKNMSVEERAGKCRRWHARFRRRLKRGKQLSSIWGRWLPEDRISLDQVGRCKH